MFREPSLLPVSVYGGFMARTAPHRATAGFIGLLLVALGGVVARAADPQPYTVTLKPTGNAALDAALTSSASLISLQKNAPVGPFALVTRAQQDEDRFRTALNSFGYYKAHIAISIANRALDDPGLVPFLDQAPADPPVPVQASFDLGPLFHIGQVDIQGTVPAEARSGLGLVQGQPALAASVLAARQNLLDAIRQAGYPLATVDMPPATVRLATDTLDVDFKADTGPKAVIGPVTVTGLKNMNEDFVRRRLLLHEGEPYSPAAIEKARADLASLGVFSQVRAMPAEHLNAQGQLPVTFDVAERKLHSVDISAAYSTDLGPNFNVGWHDRNLFGNAEQLNITAGNQFGGTAVTKPGFLAGIQFIKPDFLARDQSLEADLNIIDQSLQAYEQKAVTEKIAINRKLSDHWTGSVGVLGEQENITQESVERHYNLVGLPVTAKYDDTDSLFDPTKGIRVVLSATPLESLGGYHNSAFAIVQASGSTYFDFSGTGRSILAVRGLIGEASGASVFSLPPDQRFYAGGSSTVRGYRYQSVGPQFPNNREPTGGTAIAAGGIEFRQRFLENYGVVAFVDTGQVTARGSPYSSSWQVGAGIGARYYTSIGPIRLDFAVPLNKRPGDDSFEVYIGIGQAF